MGNKSIPNIAIETIGKGRRPLKAIKGFVDLPCWSDYFLTKEPNYLFKTKVMKNGRIELWVDGQINDGGTFHIDHEQTNAYFYLLEHQERIKNSILQTLKQEFPAYRCICCLGSRRRRLS